MPVEAIAAGPEGVWLWSPNGTVLAIDPASNAVAARVEVPVGKFGGIAVGSGSVWVTDWDHARLLRIDPKTNSVAEAIEVGTNPQQMLVTPDAVWVANFRGGSISKVDAAGGVVATFSFADQGTRGPNGVVQVDGDLWTDVSGVRTVVRLDPTDGRVMASIPIAGEFLGMPFTDGRFVYFRTGVGTIVKIDPRTNATVEAFPPGVVPDFFGLSGFWGASLGDLIRFDPLTLTPSQRWAVFADAAEPWPDYAIAFGDRTVWLAQGQRLLRIAPER